MFLIVGFEFAFFFIQQHINIVTNISNSNALDAQISPITSFLCWQYQLHTSGYSGFGVGKGDSGLAPWFFKLISGLKITA